LARKPDKSGDVSQLVRCAAKPNFGVRLAEGLAFWVTVVCGFAGGAEGDGGAVDAGNESPTAAAIALAQATRRSVRFGLAKMAGSEVTQPIITLLTREMR
jgi:hypothetical protein